MPLTWADVQARKTRRTITHPVATDDDAVTAYLIAKADLNDARNRRVPAAELRGKQRAMDVAEQVVRDTTLLFRLRAMPADEYAALRAEHPPTPEDDARAVKDTGRDEAKAEFCFRTFAPVLVAACLLEPTVTVEQAEQMRHDWNEAEWVGLFNAAVLVNQTATPTAGLVFN